jgi:hypothetical protein
MASVSPTPKRNYVIVQIALAVALVLACGCSTGARILAPGWLLVIFGIFLVLLPLFIHLIIHAIVVARAGRAKGVLFVPVFLSHLFLFLCFLSQPDFGDTGGAYSGLSAMLSWIDIELPGMSGDDAFVLPIVFAILLFSPGSRCICRGSITNGLMSKGQYKKLLQANSLEGVRIHAAVDFDFTTSQIASGCFAATCNNTRAAPSGTRRPCSQLRSVLTLMTSKAANSS